MDQRTQDLISGFSEAFGEAPTAGVRAPGRVNLIGEHTDYNDGFCLPMAIEREMRMVLKPRTDRLVRVVDVNFASNNRAEFELSAEIARDPAVKWADYIKGSLQVLIEAGIEVVGMDLAIGGDVPLGSGLSSSAALEVATIHAALTASGASVSGSEIATLAQRAENQYVGNNCGILDQLASACCPEGSAVLMDCRSLGLTPVPLPAGVVVVIADTGKRRGLVDSAYNERRSQCEAGAAALAVSHLRDVDLHGLTQARDAKAIDALTFDRCAHVVAENGRTVAAAACLRAGDAVALGALMDQSHADLRDRFAVSCDELDAMTGIARSLPGCLGSRMTGAGFGGCCVSLIAVDAVDAFVPALLEAYGKRYDHTAAAYVTGAAPGAGQLALG